MPQHLSYCLQLIPAFHVDAGSKSKPLHLQSSSSFMSLETQQRWPKHLGPCDPHRDPAGAQFWALQPFQVNPRMEVCPIALSCVSLSPLSNAFKKIHLTKEIKTFFLMCLIAKSQIINRSATHKLGWLYAS